MPVSVRWLDDKQTVILLTAEGKYSMREYFEALSKGYELARTVGHRVGFIYDRRNGDQLPPGKDDPPMPTDLPPNAGMTVVVLTIPPEAKNNLLNRMLNHVAKQGRVSPQSNYQNYAAETIEEAVTKLALLQASLDG